MSIQRYLVRRVVQAIPLLIGISIISFIIIHAAPGDPTMQFLDPNSTVEDMQRVRTLLGLDRPIYVQYWRWFTRILVGDFGRSFADGRPVLTRIVERLPATLELTTSALLVSLILAVPIGILSAVKQYSKFDYTATTLAFFGLGMPSFWFGMLAILLFSVYLGWLPACGRMPMVGTVTLVGRLRYLLMPVLVLGLQRTARFTRFMRSSMLEVIRQDYIRTARSKGLSERVVIYRHALKNALIPVITILGLSIPALIGGSLIVEQVFAWPGMARMSIAAVFRRDYPVIMGVNLVAAGMVIAGNLVADLAYGLVDPRVRYD